MTAWAKPADTGSGRRRSNLQGMPVARIRPIATPDNPSFLDEIGSAGGSLVRAGNGVERKSASTASRP